jgi:carbon storage regulator
MLVLTRKVGQAICISSDIRIHVIRCERGKVRLAIEAPPEARVVRGELAAQAESEPEPEGHPRRVPRPPRQGQ